MKRPDGSTRARSHAQRETVAVAQFGNELACQRQVPGAGALRNHNRDLLVHRKAILPKRQLLRFREDQRPVRGGCPCGGSQDAPIYPTHARPPDDVYNTWIHPFPTRSDVIRTTPSSGLDGTEVTMAAAWTSILVESSHNT